MWTYWRSIAVVMAMLGAASEPRAATAQLAPPAGFQLYLPAVQQWQPVEITDSSDGFSCKSFCVAVQGHVRNNTATAIYGVRVQADFYDQDEQHFASQTFAVALPVIFAGEMVPFRTQVARPLAVTSSRYELRIIDGTRVSPLMYVPVTIVSMHVEHGAVTRVYGAMRNAYQHPLRDVHIIVATGGGDYESVRVATLAPHASAEYETRSVYYREWASESLSVQGIGILTP